MNNQERKEMEQLISGLGLSMTMREMVESVYKIAFNCGRLHENNARIALLKERIDADK